MSGEKSANRSWFVDLGSDDVRLRCSFHRFGKRIVQFTVQLEIKEQDKWRPVVRYDNAHGFCHRDTLRPDGTQDKTGVYIGDVNETFTFAIEDLRTNWEAYCSRYRGEMKS
jgi:hypothetical protein